MPAPPRFAPAALHVAELPDGSRVLSCPHTLRPYARCVGEWLARWAREAPERTFLAERPQATGATVPNPLGEVRDGWRRISYARTLAAVEALGQVLLERGLAAGPEPRPLVILAENSIPHGLLALAAMHVGIPVAPVSAAYSLASKDFSQLRHVLELVRPGLVFAPDARFAPALGAVSELLQGVEIVVEQSWPGGRPSTPLSSLLAVGPGAAAREAFARVGPDTVAKILFTSGSTGLPKGVINTQRMLCSNQESWAQVWPFVEEQPPVLVDWLPWNHTFAGNGCLGLVLRNGGTYFIDEGRPLPGLIERTVANLRDVSPTLYLNVPRGFDLLLPYLQRDELLRTVFFRNLQGVFYAGAALPPHLWEGLEQVALQARGSPITMLSAWGSTETAPMATVVYYPIHRAGILGLPGPGTEIKLVPNGAKLELRVRGPNVTPGYWKRPDLTKAAFDEEGFYRIGDAGRFAQPENPLLGLEFDGRIAEDFKLMSGTWVHVGLLRVRTISAGAPAIQDVVVAGHDREEVGLLVFPNLAGCRTLCSGLPADAPPSAVLAQPAVRARVAQAMAAQTQHGEGSSMRPTRALLLEEPPQIDANEITDKGYINQRAVLERRAGLVDRLYRQPADKNVVLAAT